MIKLSKKLKSQKGAMDKVLVTLLMIVVAISALIGIEAWVTNNKAELINQSNSTISSVLNE